MADALMYIAKQKGNLTTSEIILNSDPTLNQKIGIDQKITDAVSLETSGIVRGKTF
jgi:hypothetical protein